MALASNYPQAQGLYDPASEHDACGVAMVATLNKIATHEIVSQALTALRNMEHRGASGAEPDSGDGAGILIRIPDKYFQEVSEFKIPSAGAYATGIAFVAKGSNFKDQIKKILMKLIDGAAKKILLKHAGGSTKRTKTTGTLRAT